MSARKVTCRICFEEIDDPIPTRNNSTVLNDATFHFIKNHLNVFVKYLHSINLESNPDSDFLLEFAKMNIRDDNMIVHNLVGEVEKRLREFARKKYGDDAVESLFTESLGFSVLISDLLKRVGF